MKKFLSYFVVLTIILSLFSVPVNVLGADASQTVAELDSAEKTFIGLGIVDGATYNSQALLSRADFASFIAKMCKFVPDDKDYQDGMNNLYGEDNKDVVYDGVKTQIFDDVDATMAEYEAINAMYANGYMKGITPTYFGPYYDITAGEVVKVLVSMLGREMLAEHKGGYPNGYMDVARSIKLTSGVNVASNEFITMKQTLNLFYNAFDINVYDITGIDGDGGVQYTDTGYTFIEKCMDMNYIEGNMTDNGVSTFYGSSKVGLDQVIIGGKAFYLGNADYARGYLGRNLLAYYEEDEAGKKQLLYVLPSASDKYETFSAKDFAGYTSDAMKYYDENGKLETARLSSSKTVIYNNSVIGRYNEDTFNFLFGDITLISTEGSTYDVVVVNDYMAGKINKIIGADKVLYSETLYGTMNDVKKLDLGEENGKIVVITDANGNSIGFDDLATGNVISVTKNEDGSYINVKVCSAAVTSFEIANYSQSGDVIEVTNGTDTYKLSGVSELASPLNIKLGELYDLYFDYDGNLIWLENLADSTDLKKAFLAQVGDDSNGLNSSFAARIYTEDGLLAVYKFDKKLILNHKTVNAEDAIAELEKEIGKIILYRADEEAGVLKAVVTPLTFGIDDNGERGWYEASPYVKLSRGDETDDQWSKYQSDNVSLRYVYEGNNAMLDKVFTWDKNNSKIFSIPGDLDEYNVEKRYKVKNTTFASNTGYYLNCYDRNYGSMKPDVFVMSGGSASGAEIYQRTAFIITKAVNTVNEEGDPVKAYRGYNMTYNTSSPVEATLVLSSEVEFVDALNNPASDENPDVVQVELEPGDIIRYATNVDNEVTSIFVTYDKNENKAYPFGRSSLDWRDSDAYTGYAYVVSENCIRVTMDPPHLVQSKAEELYPTVTPERALFEYLANRNTAILHQYGKIVMVVEDDARGGIVIRQGSADDIISFKESGELDEDAYDIVVGLETSWGYPVGTVIYKK